MKFDYRFPALVSALPRGKRARRNVLALLAGEADIPEIAPDEAPIACTFEWKGAVHAFRYADGGFYLATSASRFDGSWSSWAQDILYLRLFCEIAAGSERQDARVWPDEDSDTLADLCSAAGHGLYASLLCLPGRLPAMVDISTFSEPDPEDIRYWTERAGEFASMGLLIGGQLWTRVPEPLLEVNGDRIQLANMAVYGHVSNRLLPLPAPFGPSDLCLDKYWQSSSCYFPVSEFESVRDASATNRASTLLSSTDLAMPEVFGRDMFFTELERRSRLAVADAREKLFDRFSWVSGVPVAMRNTYRDIRDAVHPRTGVPVDGDVLADMLETFLSGWRDHTHRALYGKPMSFSESVNALELGFQAVDRWRERPIAVDPIAGTMPLKTGV